HQQGIAGLKTRKGCLRRVGREAACGCGRAHDGILARRSNEYKRFIGWSRVPQEKARVQFVRHDMSGDDLRICVISDRRAEAHLRSGAMRNNRLIEPFSAGVYEPAAGEQCLAGDRQTLDLVREIDGGIAENQNSQTSFLTTDMKALTRSGSTSFH